MNLQSILIENSNNAAKQDEIREAAIKGAHEAGFNLILGYDNIPKAGTRYTYENWEDCIIAAIDRVKETVEI